MNTAKAFHRYREVVTATSWIQSPRLESLSDEAETQEIRTQRDITPRLVMSRTWNQKDSDQQVVVQVEGIADHHAQTGLSSGQEYTATITGEIDGKTGASKVLQFSTLTSSPTKLRVVKTSTSSAVVQWEPAQGEIDRYHLTVSPNDRAGKAQEITLPPESDSAHLKHLKAGRLYDIILRAESAVGQSSAAVTQVTPDSLWTNVFVGSCLANF
ncbi:hypothetical protein CRUP_003648 [Coryphaenoides rupestris]|nr:hypothetical protein CRUP_003648 [Coryphaenoides rupestris]